MALERTELLGGLGIVFGIYMTSNDTNEAFQLDDQRLKRVSIHGILWT